jgi:hypothetical protein
MNQYVVVVVLLLLLLLAAYCKGDVTGARQGLDCVGAASISALDEGGLRLSAAQGT